MVKNMKTNWKLFIILLIGSIFGVITIIPYSLTLQGVLLENLPPFYVILTTTIIQNVVIFAIPIFIGLNLAKKVGLGLPILEGWLEGREVKSYLKSILGISIGLGLIAGALIVGLDYLFSLVGITTNIAVAGQIYPPAWQGFLASFYGGINEEILLRLFLMTLIAWIIFKIKKTEEGKPTSAGMWLAIVLAAIIFGIGHLPAVLAITTPTTLLIARIIILNAIGGIIFGWLYWKKGLESAMISHFSADIVLHVIVPFIVLM
jgi:hypothetical protein